MIGDHHHRLLSARSIPTIALLTGANTRSRASLALRLRSPRDTPLPDLDELINPLVGVRGSDSDDDLSSGVPLLQIPDGLRGLA